MLITHTFRTSEEREQETTIFKGNTAIPTVDFVTNSTESWDDSSKSNMCHFSSVSVAKCCINFAVVDYVVEIKPHEGLFTSTSTRMHNGRSMNTRPRAVVSNPPQPRMPREGTGSEVWAQPPNM